jgi:hypothetical protein
VRKKYPLVLLIDLTDIYRGALAAVVGAASMVQPELLPGAVAIVGKMASDAAKKTVINIATTEGKKVGAAIGKDISNDAAKEKAANAGTSETSKSVPDATKAAGEGSSGVKPTASNVPQDASKATKAPNRLISTSPDRDSQASESGG